ncbi:MAG: hypothetical protein EOO08_04485 [Chitinophagaceae bacterium]|nr:MAG: hypothetical protein EOO08_04485 [Chitinophagaceae bacterium]
MRTAFRTPALRQPFLLLFLLALFFVMSYFSRMTVANTNPIARAREPDPALQSTWYRPWFLLLFPLYAILHVSIDNLALLEVRFVWKEWAALIAIPAGFYLLCSLCFRNAGKGALASVLFCYLFICGPAFKVWLNTHVPVFLTSSLLWALLLIPIATWILLQIRRGTKRLWKAISFTNALLLVLLLVEGVRYISIGPQDQLLVRAAKIRVPEHAATPNGPLPDVYHLVFDEYASSAQLAKMGFNNDALESELSAMGFHVIDSSRSNYRSTMLSMSSVFNAMYLDNLDTTKPPRYSDYLRGQETIARAPLFQMLRAEGYELMNYSNFPIEGARQLVQRYDYWDQRGLYRSQNLFSYFHYELGWRLPPGLRHAWGNTDEDYLTWRFSYHDALLRGLDSLSRSKSLKPRFVYAHFQIPHAPYSYDSAGRHQSTVIPRNRDEELRAYLAQVRYANKLMLRITSGIIHQQDSVRPFVIILQSDHGVRLQFRANDLSSHHNFSALYYSDRNYVDLQDNMMLVNTYPVVIEHFFKVGLLREPDKTAQY